MPRLPPVTMRTPASLTTRRLLDLPLLHARRPALLHRHLEPERCGRDRRERDDVVLVELDAERAAGLYRLPLIAVLVEDAPRCRHAHFPASSVVEPVDLDLRHRRRLWKVVLQPLGRA